MSLDNVLTARVLVIEGREEIARIASLYQLEEFDLFDNEQGNAPDDVSD